MTSWKLVPGAFVFVVLFLLQAGVAQTASVPIQNGATSSPSAFSPQTAPEANAAVSGNPLVIGPGDLLETTIFGSDYSCGTVGQTDSVVPGCRVRVSNAGDITLPLVGRVKVAGLTVEQAQDLVARRLVEGRYYKDPQVTIVQKEFSTQGISLLGEVQKPGTYPLIGPHSLLEAISAAGGITLQAGNEVTITHRNRPNAPQTLQLSDRSAGGTLVQPGDVVVVSKAGIVYVVGDVRQPTGIVMQNTGLTVLQAIAMAQGTTPTSALNRAKLIRTTAHGKEEIPIQIKKILSNKKEDIKLQASDILFIPSSTAKAAAGRALGVIQQTTSGLAIYRP